MGVLQVSEKKTKDNNKPVMAAGHWPLLGTIAIKHTNDKQILNIINLDNLIMCCLLPGIANMFIVAILGVCVAT